MTVSRRTLITIAAVYVGVVVFALLAFQTHYLSGDTFLTPQPGRAEALQVRGAIVYVSAVEYWLFKIGSYSAIVIALGIVFGSALVRRISK